jgi:hypothetical protein
MGRIPGPVRMVAGVYLFLKEVPLGSWLELPEDEGHKISMPPIIARSQRGMTVFYVGNSPPGEERTPAQRYVLSRGAPSYETNLHTIDFASCRGVHSDRMLLE